MKWAWTLGSVQFTPTIKLTLVEANVLNSVISCRSHAPGHKWAGLSATCGWLYVSLGHCMVPPTIVLVAIVKYSWVWSKTPIIKINNSLSSDFVLCVQLVWRVMIFYFLQTSIQANAFTCMWTILLGLIITKAFENVCITSFVAESQQVVIASVLTALGQQV